MQHSSIRRRSMGLGLLICLTSSQVAAFAPNEVYWAPGSCGSTCGLFDVTAGGDQLGATPIALIERAPGQIVWTSNPLAAYVTEFDLDQVVQVSAGGTVTIFATGIDGATGLLLDDTERILAVSFNDAAVYDITAGGSFSGATAFATGLGGPRNLLQLSTGEILVADQASTARAIIDITAGGDFSSATPWASGFPPDGPYDLVETPAGRVYASTDDGVYDVTGGGDFASATPHATGQFFSGLAVDDTGRLLASVQTSGEVFDITVSGDYAAVTPFATNLDGIGDTALDSVPGTLTALVPSIAGWGLMLLAGLLSVTTMGSLRMPVRR